MSELYERIYKAVQKIPRGKVATYAQVAAMAGNPRMCRVVGNALHQNPYYGIVPCHRVVNAKGCLAQAFVFGGENVQADMLREEGVEVINGKVDIDKYGIGVIGKAVVRIATPFDAENILKIYAPYVENSEITFEYTVPSVEEFAWRIECLLKRYPYLVAELDGEIVGYTYASAFKERAAYDWSVETSIYVKQGYHGIGIGKTLYSKLEECLKEQNVKILNACITFPNPQSISFHNSFGYKQVAHFSSCGYKHGKWCDMIWMEKHISPHDIPCNAFVPFSKLEEAGRLCV